MTRITGQQTFLLSVLLLVVFLAMSRSNAESRAGDTATEPRTIQAQAGGEHLQQVTLRITGLS
ncbi:MAG: hypothetical protein V3U27_04870 [Candidatus Tectomicrobia bacterium]